MTRPLTLAALLTAALLGWAVGATTTPVQLVYQIDVPPLIQEIQP